MGRLLRKHRGIAVGVAVAIIVLVAVSAYVMYKLWETYAVAYKAITEYGVTVQKPVFEITGIMPNASNVVVTITNRGPSAAYVSAVHVYKYVASDVPRDVDTIQLNKYVPVGNSFTITLPYDRIREYVSYSRPLRILIETDKGLVLIGTKVPVTDAVINVYFPSYYRPSWSNHPTLEIDCSQAGGGAFIIPLYTYTDPYTTVTCTGHTCTVITKLWGLGTCEVRFRDGEIRYRGVHANWTTQGNQKNIPIGGFTQTIQLSQLGIVGKILISPGSNPTLDIKLPELLQIESPFKHYIPTGGYTQIIDFSWYFMPYLDSGQIREDANIHMYAPYKTAYELIKNGAVIVTSPMGCKISPSDADSDEEKRMISRLIYRYEWQNPLVSLHYSIQTGLPIVIHNYPDSCSNMYNGNGIIMDVTVPIQLGDGRYIIIPVFGYDDVNDYELQFGWPPINPNTVQTNITVYVTDANGNIVGTWILGEVPTFDVGISQFASPVIVNAKRGTYYLHIVVKDTKLARGENTGKADWVYIILSKIVVIRTAGFSGVCAYQVPANKGPQFPWVEIDTASGDITRYAKIIFNPLEKATSENDARNKAPHMALYSTRYGTGGVLTYSSSGMFISGYAIDDVRPHYIAPGYSVSVSVSTSSLPAPDVESFLEMGAEPDDTTGYYDYLYVDSALINHEMMPSIVTGVMSYDDDDVSTDISITFGESGEHYVFIGLDYSTNNHDYKTLPWFTISTTGSISYTVLYPTYQEGDRYSFRYDRGIGAEIIIRVVATSGSTLTIHLHSGKNTADRYHTYIIISHIIVVKPPDVAPNVVAPELSPTLPGIYLIHVNAIPSYSGSASAFLIRSDTGGEVAHWTFTVPWKNSVILLSVLGFNNILYSSAPFDTDTEKRLVEWPQYILIVYGIACTPSQTNTSLRQSTTPSATPSVRWYRTSITIHSSVTVNDYQEKIVLDSNWDGWSKGAKKGSIYFKDENGNPLYFWIQEWDENARRAIIWVKTNIVDGTKTIYMYWSPDADTSQYASYNNPNNVFLFFDNLETWSGWNTFRHGKISQDTSVAYEGSASLKKDTYPDPNGGYKVLPTPIPSSTDFVLEVYVRRSRLTGYDADRFGLLDKAPTGSNYVLGYGPILVHGSTSFFKIERRYGSWPSASSVTYTSYYNSNLLNKWLKVVMIWDYRTPSQARIYGYVYDGSTRIMSVSGTIYGSSNIPNQFSVFYVFGGYPYNIDLIIIRKYVSPEPTVSVSTTSEQV